MPQTQKIKLLKSKEENKMEFLQFRIRRLWKEKAKLLKFCYHILQIRKISMVRNKDKDENYTISEIIKFCGKNKNENFKFLEFILQC